MRLSSNFRFFFCLFCFSGNTSTSTNTLQVPCFAIDSTALSPSHSSSKLRVSLLWPSRRSNFTFHLIKWYIHLKVKAEENLKRSISNPGASTSPVSTPSNGHCPVLRTGAALGCNYCWNTNDSHGRILRRKTKYHCPDCQANLCIVPCFQVSRLPFVKSSTNLTIVMFDW